MLKGRGEYVVKRAAARKRFRIDASDCAAGVPGVQRRKAARSNAAELAACRHTSALFLNARKKDLKSQRG